MYSTSHTEDFVKELYTKIGILEPQQLQFQFIASRLGINVFYWPEPSQALFLKDYAYIFLNENVTDQKKWQEFCHELGHVLLHAGNQCQISPSFREYQESKANHFMYHACVPFFMLDELQINDYTNESVLLVQQQFNVEKEFAVHRLTQYLNKRLLF